MLQVQFLSQTAGQTFFTASPAYFVRNSITVQPVQVSQFLVQLAFFVLAPLLPLYLAYQARITLSRLRVHVSPAPQTLTPLSILYPAHHVLPLHLVFHLLGAVVAWVIPAALGLPPACLAVRDFMQTLPPTAAPPAQQAATVSHLAPLLPCPASRAQLLQAFTAHQAALQLQVSPALLAFTAALVALLCLSPVSLLLLALPALLAALLTLHLSALSATAARVAVHHPYPALVQLPAGPLALSPPPPTPQCGSSAPWLALAAHL